MLLAGLIGGATLGLIGALMAIPIAAGGKVLLSERLQARDAAGTDAAAPAPARRPRNLVRLLLMRRLQVQPSPSTALTSRRSRRRPARRPRPG